MATCAFSGGPRWLDTENALPQSSGQLFLTEGGMETTLVFHEGVELPHFAAFHLMHHAEGKALMSTCRSRSPSLSRPTAGCPRAPSLREAIEQVDRQTDSYPQYYMINCAHPTHFESALSDDARLGVRGQSRGTASPINWLAIPRPEGAALCRSVAADLLDDALCRKGGLEQLPGGHIGVEGP